MKKKKKIVIICIVVGIIIIAASLYLLFSTRQKAPTLQEKGTEIVESISDSMKNGASLKEIEKLIGVDDLTNTTIMVGSDSYVRDKPSDEIITANNLSSYVSLNEQYSENLEKKIKDNFDCKIDIFNTEQGIVSIKADIKNYYYAVYLQDMIELQSQLLERTQAVNNEVNSYKAKVRAMQILDSKLEQYVNDDETISQLVSYKRDNDDERKNSLSSFVIALAGFNYHNDTTNAFEKNRETRISGYIDEAINSGIISENNL